MQGADSTETSLGNWDAKTASLVPKAAMRPTLAKTGAVLGVDVGFSPTRRSSAVCRLDWTEASVSFSIARFRAVEPERGETLRQLADRPLAAAAFDGPLAPGLGLIGRYRPAEAMLTRRIGKNIGKPGSSGAPVGRALNEAANACAAIVRATGHVAPASHETRIDKTAMIEAFPGAALGLLIETPGALAVRRGDRSDKFYEHLETSGGLARWLVHLLPGRRLASPFHAVENHDDRAALVCALTALGLAAGSFSAVGGALGWIILPPRALMADWAWPLLAANAAESAGRPFDGVGR